MKSKIITFFVALFSSLLIVLRRCFILLPVAILGYILSLVFPTLGWISTAVLAVYAIGLIHVLPAIIVAFVAVFLAVTFFQEVL